MHLSVPWVCCGKHRVHIYVYVTIWWGIVQPYTVYLGHPNLYKGLRDNQGGPPNNVNKSVVKQARLGTLDTRIFISA